jgi:sialate O-acetylesterase
MIYSRILLVLLSACPVLSSHANIRLPHILGSNMVLQQQSAVKLWGWGEPNEKVTVTTSWDNKTYAAVTVTGNATWMLTVQTPAAGGAYTIHLKGRNTIVLSNIMIGEVWICSGQSNMEMSGSWGLEDIKAEYATAHLKNIRLFHVTKTSAAYPQQDCDGGWKQSDSNSLATFSAVAFFFGKKLNSALDVPIGLVETCWSGSSAEVWTPDSVVCHDAVLKDAATRVLPNGQVPHLPGYVYNAMIAPITNMSIAGVAWYQGENNTQSASTYPQLFTAMIRSWRKAFGKDFPFYYVQVAPYRYHQKNIGALLREAQAKSMVIPNSGMVVTTDLVTDTNDVHPHNKHDVGLRLANYALASTYHQPGIDYLSPTFQRMAIDKDKIIASIDQDVVIKGKQVVELYVAGEDRIFYPAEATIKNNQLIAWNKLVKKPVALRYGFSNTAMGNIFGKNGLPLAPFRTDNWPVENEYIPLQ